MNFRETELEGVVTIDVERRVDQRGFFARCWCPHEFAANRVDMSLAQASVAYSHRQGTLRGLHYQAPPHAEDKLLRCTQGAAFVVAVDLRPESPSYLRWTGVELSAENRRLLYLPKGMAQGYQTLRDRTEIFYQMSQFYEPSAKRGIRFDDPHLHISWPLPVRVISDADRNLPSVRP